VATDPQLFVFEVFVIILLWEGVIRHLLVDPD